MVKAAAGAMAVRALKGRRGMGLAGVGGGGAGVGWDDSVVPLGPRGWESRAPIFGDLVLGGFGVFWGVYWFGWWLQWDC